MASNQQIWGLEVSVGPSVPLAASASVNISGATLVPLNPAVSDSSLGMVQYLLSAQVGDKKTVLCSLSAARPHVPLQLQSALKSAKTAFQVSTVPTSAAASATYSVHLSGYSFTAGAAAAAAAPAAAAAAVPQTPKRKASDAEAPASKANSNKKAKTDSKPASAASSDIDDDDEDSAPAPTPAPKSAPATPTTPKKSGIVTLKNGLKLQDTKVGTGKEAVDRSAVGIRYRGSLASNGKVFDSNMPRGQPLRFKIGGGDVIAGFEQGTKGMKVGGTRTVVIPANLGYGARGAPPDIPANATLVFDLELVSVK